MSEEQQTLALKAKHFPDVQSGQCSVTVREGYRPVRLGPLTFVEGQSHLQVFVEAVVHTRLGALNDKVANAAGHASATECREALHDLYPNITQESEITVVEFSLPY